MKPTLGDSVAVGLLAGPEDFERVRGRLSNGLMARLWLQLEAAVADPAKQTANLWIGDLAFAAAVSRRHDWATLAIDKALEIAHRPISSWIHPEAGCMTLTGMHYAHQLCLVTDWLWPLLNRDQREALLGAIVAKSLENQSRAPDGLRTEPGDRGILLFARRMDKNDPHCLHPRPEQVNNWDLWFSGGLFMGACLAERAWLKPDADWPRLKWGRYYDVGYALDAARIERWKGIARERIASAVAAQLGPDGDYAEGLAYAGYGGQALLIALTLLERRDGAALPSSVFPLPRWARSQFVAGIGSGAANFNDSRIATGLPLFLLATLAARKRDPEIQGYAMEMLDRSIGTPDCLTLLGLDPAVPAKPVTLPDALCFNHTGTVIWRTAQDKSGVFFALKSGAHGGAHQHQDRNTFFLSAYGEHLVVDTGDSRYAKPPDPDFARTIAHNCLLIDGQGQFGDNNRPVAGRIVEHVHKDSVSTLLADATACYEGITACRRRVVFMRPDLIVMADRVDGTCTNLTWLLQGYNPDGAAQWQCDRLKAALVRPAARLHVLFGQPVDGFAVTPGTLDGEAKAILRLAANVKGNRFLAVLVPVKADEEAPACTRSEDGTLSIRFRGHTHTVHMAADQLTVDGQQFGL